MKHIASLFLVFAGLAINQPAYATSTLSFAGDSFEIQIVISDTRDEIAGFRLYEANRLLLAAEPTELAEARFDPKKQTIDLVLPAKDNTPKLVLAVRGKNATMFFGRKRVKLRGDWLR